MKFRFQGYSDDTFGEYEQSNDDYDNCGSGRPIQYSVWNTDGQGVIVTGIYCCGNYGEGWMIGVAVDNEEAGLDGWEFQLNPAHEGYRGELVIIAPEGTLIKCLNREDTHINKQCHQED